MKILTLILVLTFLEYPATSQIKDSIHEDVNPIEFNPLCLILGTLSDYMGRFTYVDKPDQIDRYYPHEKSLMNFLDSLIFVDFNIKVSSNDRNETFSQEFARKINSYYRKDKLLSADQFTDQDQIISFLTGKFYRYGRQINDTLFLIQMANSPNHQICESLLRKANCTNIHFKYLTNIPAQFIYFFVPTKELKNQFDSIAKQKEILDSAYYQTIEDLRSFEKKEHSKLKSEIREKDLSRFLELVHNHDNNKF